jgi:hypothetical protein
MDNSLRGGTRMRIRDYSSAKSWRAKPTYAISEKFGAEVSQKVGVLSRPISRIEEERIVYWDI